ncbi:MAG: hypothetical protein HYY03_02185 [Chloroflexi bacterium]|nr:hypothetical protein [Chloroflexota bacterium]
MAHVALDLTPFIQARDRAADYLVARQRPDGDPHRGLIGEPEWGLGSYYKALWALAAAGRTGEAARLLAWVRENGFDPETGDFRGEYPRGAGLEAVYPYPNAWLAIGAQKLGAFHIARRAADFLVTLQDPASGGFRARIDVEPDRAPQDIMSSSQAGLACLFAGRLGNARACGGFLRTLMDAQPQPEERLYFIWSRGALRTEFKPEAARFFAVQFEQPLQWYFQIGIAAAFLSRLAMTTGARSELDLARRYIDLAFRCTDAMYETAQVGKVGWGAALVYQLTGDDRYRDLALRVADALLTQQNPDGSWHNTGGFTEQVVTDEVTAEFVVLLDEMVQGLSAT